jgi:transcriptional regulator with XRE-family HTH domain
MVEKHLNIDKIKEKMSSLGLSQSELADKLNVSKESVSQWVKGNKFPRPGKLLALSKAFQLSFNEIVLKHTEYAPIIAYRTNKNKKVTSEHETIAKDMGEMLKVLLPYLNGDSVFSSPIISSPETDDYYVQKVVKELKERIGNEVIEISFADIMSLYDDFRIILVPVMWGLNGDNGLYIHLPKSSITFVYANLEKVITDFKFWLLHELAHAMTPDLEGDNAEYFADSFAAAMLFPENLAEQYYNEIKKIKNPGIAINTIKRLASKLAISPYTIFNEINRYAERNSLPILDFNIGGAVANFNKQVRLVSEIIFEEENPEAEKYIETCKNVFGTPFFDALEEYIRNEKKEAGIVQRLMNIPLADAKGVHRVLANKKDPA